MVGSLYNLITYDRTSMNVPKIMVSKGIANARKNADSHPTSKFLFNRLF